MANWGNPGNNNLKQGIYNGMVPKEGPKTIPIKVDLTVNTTADIDFSQQNALEQISFIQGVYIDNSNNAAALTLVCQGSGQIIEAPAGAQGYVPLLATLPNKFTVATSGGVIVPLFFYNVPMPAAVWGEGSGAFQFDVNGYLQVAEPNLDALINTRDGTNPALDVNVVYSVGSAAGASGLPPVVVTSGGAAGVINLTLLNPSATQKFKVTGLAIYWDNYIYDDDGSAGTYSWSVIEGISTSVVYTLASGRWYIPPKPRLEWGRNYSTSELLYQSPPGMYYESSAVDNPLTFTMPGFVFDAGSLRVIVNGQVYTP